MSKLQGGPIRGNPALAMAVKKADENLLRDILRDHGIENEQGYDLLCDTVDKGQLSMAELLLNAGAPCHCESATRLSPLIITSYRNDLHLVRLLLRIGCYHSEEVLQEALFEAIVNGHDEVAALLVEAGAPADHSSHSQFDALAACCGKRCLQTACALLKRGVPRLAVQRALHEALCKGHDAESALLLKYGATLGPLAHEAAAAGCTETMRIGLSRGLIPGVPGRHSLLHSAAQGFGQQLCSLESYFRTADLLIAAGAEVNCRNGLGRSPLMGGLLHAQEDTAGFVVGMLTRGADPNLQDIFGISPVHLAAEAGAAEALEVLIEAGGRVDSTDWEGRVPLHLATEESLPVLLRHFGNLDAVNRQGMSAMAHVQELAMNNEAVAEEIAAHFQILVLADLPLPVLDSCFKLVVTSYLMASRGLNVTELEYMKSKHMLNITYYDFLVNPSPYKLVSLSDRESLLELASAVDAKTIFPSYSGLWLKRMGQLSQKIRRDKLYEHSSWLLNEFTDRNIPYIVSDIIFGYLSEEDLKNFTSCEQYKL